MLTPELVQLSPDSDGFSDPWRLRVSLSFPFPFPLLLAALMPFVLRRVLSSPFVLVLSLIFPTELPAGFLMDPERVTREEIFTDEARFRFEGRDEVDSGPRLTVDEPFSSLENGSSPFSVGVSCLPAAPVD